MTLSPGEISVTPLPILVTTPALSPPGVQGN